MKEYISPELDVVLINVEDIITSSPTIDEDGPEIGAGDLFG